MTARSHIIPIFLPHWGCPYHCVYCDQKVISSQAGPVEVTRQIDAALQKVPPGVHPVEVAFYGGTFTALSLDLQKDLLQAAGPYLKNGRVDSIRLSTHPACLSLESLTLLAAAGVKIIELGVQSMDPEVLRLSGREYGPDTVENAVSILNQHGFKVGIQLMPGLPGDTKAKALDTVRQVINLRPDFVRVYPTVVIDGTPLTGLWGEGKFKPLSLEEAVDWCKEIGKLFMRHGIPVIRMGLHASRELEDQILAGPYHPAFKALVDSALALEKIEEQIKEAGEKLVITCNPREIPVVRGHKNANILKLKDKYGFKQIEVRAGQALAKGELEVQITGC